MGGLKLEDFKLLRKYNVIGIGFRNHNQGLEHNQNEFLFDRAGQAWYAESLILPQDLTCNPFVSLGESIFQRNFIVPLEHFSYQPVI